MISFAEGFIEYHSQCCEILKDLTKTLKERFLFYKTFIDIKTFIYLLKINRKKVIGGNSGKGKDISMGSKGIHSSSASRFYDNGAETSSSISDVYGETQDIKNGKSAYPNTGAPIGFKASIQMPSSTYKSGNVIAPPTSQRSSNYLIH